MKIERRTASLTEFRVVTEGDNRRLVGHAAVFDKLSEDLGGWRERIAKGAFAGVLGDDVRALWNHDPNHLLARTAAGTLRLSEDDAGLAMDLDPPDTTTGRDLLVLVDRGDVREMSFGFQVGDDEWITEGDQTTRVITRVARLWDVSPVTYPAYPDTDIAAHQYRAYMERVGKNPPPLPHEHRCSGCGGTLATANDLRRLHVALLDR